MNPFAPFFTPREGYKNPTLKKDGSMKWERIDGEGITGINRSGLKVTILTIRDREDRDYRKGYPYRLLVDSQDPFVGAIDSDYFKTQKEAKAMAEVLE